MSVPERVRQARTVARLQARCVFFAKRSAWVYLLALLPACAFLVHGLEVTLTRNEWADNITPSATLSALRKGDTDKAVVARAGVPQRESLAGDGEGAPEYRYMQFFDGKREWNLVFADGELQRVRSRSIIDFAFDRVAYAAVFTYFYLRLAIFFGCMGVFMNLFRGEMLDKTLHFWFLMPVRRDVLLVGKYVAGLVGSVVIFTAGAAISFLLMLWPQDAAELASFWPDPGMSHLFWYCVAVALACVGYGSIFLAAGLLLRNPIILAVVILFWESFNSFLPPTLQKLSVLYYVQALTPLPAPTDFVVPPRIQLLMVSAEPPSTTRAVFSLLALAAIVLWAAAHAVRRLEIDYSTD